MRKIKSWVARVLFDLARSRIGGRIIGWSFTYMTPFIPVNRLYETEHVVAFYHPKPCHKVHILIVPKQAIRSILDVTETDFPVMVEIILAAQYLARNLGLESKGFSLQVNGGSCQDVMQVHFHLISDDSGGNKDNA